MRRIFLIGTLGAALLAACGEQAGPPPQMPPASVGVVTIAEQPVALSTELPGRTSPYAVSEVRPQISGIVQRRLFTEGSNVKAGQPLYQIDPAPYRAVLDSAEAQLSSSRTRADSKQAQLIEMLKAPKGATIDEVVAAFGWQPHTVRGAIAGALKKKLGLEVTSEKVEGRGRVYRILG